MASITDLPVGILADIFSMLTLKQLCNIESGKSSLLCVAIFFYTNGNFSFW